MPITKCRQLKILTSTQKVLHDKITMSKLLQVVKLINGDLERVLSYIVKQAWRAKEIFDSEGVSDPGHAIPGHKMARLLSMFLCGDASQVNDIMPIVLRVVQGEHLSFLPDLKIKSFNLTNQFIHRLSFA